MKTALLLLEIQNDYFPEGRIPLEGSLKASGKAQNILQAFRERKQPIIHLQQISTNPDASYFLPCTEGAEFYSSVQPLKSETIIKKHYPNSFKDTHLLNHLNRNKISHLVICGMMTHSTIDATVREAYDLGFTCSIIHDACTAHHLAFEQTPISAQDVHHAFLAALSDHQASLFSTEEYLQIFSQRFPQEAVQTPVRIAEPA
jgi:nicotinamidase-related amidase